MLESAGDGSAAGGLRARSSGPLFESFAIAEIVKGFLHRGEPPRVFFWRDSAGNEIDLVVERGEDLHAYEIKSGKTVSADYFRGLKRFSAIASGARVRPEVVYAGDEESARDGIPGRPGRKRSLGRMQSDKSGSCRFGSGSLKIRDRDVHDNPRTGTFIETTELPQKRDRHGAELAHRLTYRPILL